MSIGPHDPLINIKGAYHKHGLRAATHGHTHACDKNDIDTYLLYFKLWIP